MHDVELAATGAEMAPGAQREGQRLGEAAGPHRADLEGVDPVAELAGLRGAKGVLGAVQVEAGQLGERESAPAPEPALAVTRAAYVLVEYVYIEYGIRLGSDDLDPVTEAGEFAREVPYVDALAAAERVPFVGEERDAQRSVAVGGRALLGTRLHGLSGHSGPPSSSSFPRDYFGTVI